MKKAVNYLSLFICSSLFAISCQSLSVSNEEAIQPEGRTFTCVFAQPDPDSKVAVDLSDGKTTWEVGDKILINAGAGGTDRRTVILTAGDITDAGKKATITIPGDLDPYDRKGDRGIESTYYAMYPADNVASGNLYYNQAFSNQNDFLMAACNVGDTFVFYNLCGVIAYTVDDGESYDFDEVVFSGKNGETVAYDTYQARVRDDGAGAEVSYVKAADAYNPLVPRTSSTNTVVSDGSTMNYIFLPGGTNFGEGSGFTFSFLSGGVIKKTASANAVKNVAPGKILKLGDISSHLEDYVAPSTHDNTISVTLASAIDLGASATANCYMLDVNNPSHAGASFKFKAAMGKGGDVLTTIASAAVLWETQNSSTAPDEGTIITAVDYDYQGGEDSYIVFKTPSPLKAGNALIAAKNAGGTVLWSWHIWIPATEVEDIDSGFAVSSKKIMDRNLGALNIATDSSTPGLDTYGLYYQWGRKDPFLSSGMKNAGSSLSVSTASAVSLATAKANPTVFYHTTGISDDWATDGSSTLWDNSGKTVNDPCPPGYRIPVRSSSYKLWEKTDTDWTFDTTTKYFKQNNFDSVFPLCGYLNSTDRSISGAGARALVWASSQNATTKGDAVMIYTGHSPVYERDNWYKRLGGVVRCVEE